MGVQGGFGVEVKIEVSSVLTAIVHVTEPELPEFEKILAEATAHDSPGGYAEYVATGKRKLNAFKCKIAWDPDETTHAAVQAAFDSDEPVSMSVMDPDGLETISFDAHIFKMGRVSEQEDYYACNVEIQPTGQPTLAVGSGS